MEAMITFQMICRLLSLGSWLLLYSSSSWSSLESHYSTPHFSEKTARKQGWLLHAPKDNACTRDVSSAEITRCLHRRCSCRVDDVKYRIDVDFRQAIVRAAIFPTTAQDTTSNGVHV